MTIDYINEEELSNKTPLPYDYNELTDELKKRAETELFEDDETRKQMLQSLKHMLKEEKDLVLPDSDEFLLAYLRARKFNLKRAFSTVKNFFHNKRKYHEVYSNYDFNTVRKTMATNTFGFLPYRDLDGSVILVMQAGSRWNPMEASLTEVMRTLTSGLLQAVSSPATQIAGFKVIVDFKGFGMKNLTNISASYLWLFADALQNCFPARFRAVHIVNEGPLFSYIWVVLKQVLSKKLKERFHFHGKNMESLHKKIHPGSLPEEYGGELGPFDNVVWAKKMEEYEDYLTDFMRTYGYQKNDRIEN